MAKKITPAAYAKDIVEAKRIVSADKRVETLHEAFKQKSVKDVKVFTDSYIKKMKVFERVGLFGLLDAAYKGEIREIWVLEFDDLIHEGEIGRQVIREFSELRIPIFSLTESHETVMQKTLNIISTSVAARKSNSTKLRSLEEGKAPAGRAPFGYKREKVEGETTTSLFIDKEEASIVKRIFDEYLDFKSMAKVAKNLTDEGVPAPAGKKWSRASVAWILANEIYIGWVKFGKERRKGLHEAIIGETVFGKVQQLRMKNRRASQKSDEPEPPKLPKPIKVDNFIAAYEIDDRVLDTDNEETHTMTAREFQQRLSEELDDIKSSRKKNI